MSSAFPLTKSPTTAGVTWRPAARKYEDVSESGWRRRRTTISSHRCSSGVSALRDDDVISRSDEPRSGMPPALSVVNAPVLPEGPSEVGPFLGTFSETSHSSK